MTPEEEIKGIDKSTYRHSWFDEITNVGLPKGRITLVLVHPIKRGGRKIGTKYTGKFTAIVLGIIFFANVQGRGRRSRRVRLTCECRTRRVEVRPDMNFKEKSQRSNDHNDIFSFLGEMPLGNSWVLASQI